MATWNLQGEDGLQEETKPKSVSNDVEVSAIIRGNGLGYPSKPTPFTENTMAFSMLFPARTLEEALENEIYFEITITPKSGKTVSIGSIVFSTKRASKRSGPNHFVVRSSLDNFASDIAGAFDTQGAPIPEGGDILITFGGTLDNLSQPVTLRFYAYGLQELNSSEGSRGLWAISNSELTGTITISTLATP